MRHCFLIAVVIAGIGIAGDHIRAQQSSVPDIEGTWVRLDTGGAGSFGAVNALTGNAVRRPHAAAGDAAGRPGGGGGRRTAETHLTERYAPSADGQRLTMSYTWNDPKIYQRAHTYQIVAERQPAGSWPFEDWCDSGDPTQRTSVIPPKQLP